MTRYVLGSEVAVSEDSDAGSSEPESAVPGGGIAWPLNKSSTTKSQDGVCLFRWCNDNHLKGTINKIKKRVLNCNTSKHDVAEKKLGMLKASSHTCSTLTSKIYTIISFCVRMYSWGGTETEKQQICCILFETWLKLLINSEHKSFDALKNVPNMNNINWLVASFDFTANVAAHFLPADTAVFFPVLTWHSDKKLDSISMSVETKLGVGHGAVWHNVAWLGTVGTVIAINSDSSAGPIWHYSCCVVGCGTREKEITKATGDAVWILSCCII